MAAQADQKQTQARPQITVGTETASSQDQRNHEQRNHEQPEPRATGTTDRKDEVPFTLAALATLAVLAGVILAALATLAVLAGVILAALAILAGVGNAGGTVSANGVVGIVRALRPPAAGCRTQDRNVFSQTGARQQTSTGVYTGVYTSLRK